MASLNRSTSPKHLILAVLICAPIACYAASIATEVCSATEKSCTCTYNDPFYNLRCASLKDVDDFKAVIANSSDNMAILEVDSVNWDYLPLDALRNSSVHTFIVANSSFVALSNSSKMSVASENVRHLSLENVTFHQPVQWKHFSSLKNLEVLFVYNTTVPSVLNSRFSRHLSRNLKAISFSESNISSVEGDSLKYLKKMEILRMTHGRLITFSRKVLPKVSHLKQLKLDFNNIHSLPVGVFENLPQLTVISLSNNSLYTLPQSTFGPLWRPNVHLELRGNPLKCDCRLRWVVEAVTKPQEIIGKCAHPKRLFGKNIKDLMVQDLDC